MRYVSPCLSRARRLRTPVPIGTTPSACAACACLLLAALAAGPAPAQEVYAKAGFLGAGLGYAHGLSRSFTLRGDLTTIGSLEHSGTTRDYDYNGKLHDTQAAAYLDWFPFGAGFRLTAGVGWRDLRGEGHPRPDESGHIRIGDSRVMVGTGDDARADVKFPEVAPYLGLGWGHNVAQRKPGWGFVADLGVFYGRPRVDLQVNPSLYTKLGIQSGDADAEIEKQKRKMQDDADALRFFPQAYVGVSYTF